MWTHFANLLERSWHLFIASLGTTKLGFISPVVVSLLTILGTLYFILRKGGIHAMVHHWKKDTRVALIVFTSVLVIVYGPLFFYEGLIKAVYEDHQSLAARNQELLGIGRGNPYSIPMNSEYASIVNTVAAFKLLSHPESGNNAKNLCAIKITSSSENKTVERELEQMASLAGCSINTPDPLHVDSADGNGELAPISKTIVIHIPMERQEGAPFATALSNAFRVKISHDIPSGTPTNLVWLQIGSGVVARDEK